MRRLERFEQWIVLRIPFCVYLRPSVDHLVNDVGLLYVLRPTALYKHDVYHFVRNSLGVGPRLFDYENFQVFRL